MECKNCTDKFCYKFTVRNFHANKRSTNQENEFQDAAYKSHSDKAPNFSDLDWTTEKTMETRPPSKSSTSNTEEEDS